MKKKLAILAFAGALALGASAAQAIPTLQLGSYAQSGSGQGTYVDYTTDGSDENTAFITGAYPPYTLLAAGAYKNQPELQIGGQYSGGMDWTYFGLQTEFAGHGAIVMATVADGSWNNTNVSVQLQGLDPFLRLDTFDAYPNNHYPVNQTRDFFFFDIGNFGNTSTVLNFDETETGSAAGQVKELAVTVVGLDLVHFDLMALVTDSKGQTEIKTTWEVNPNSHDVTWNGGTPVPEPTTMLLLGTGLIGLAAGVRRKKG